MQPKTERFEMRLDPQTMERVDAWRAEQPDLPSRSEAMRRLVTAGLGESGRDDTRITAGEKLILATLEDLYRHLNVQGEIDPEFVSKAICGGHYWALTQKYSGLFHGRADTPEVVSEVVNILSMWDSIERRYEQLPTKEKETVDLEVHPFGDPVRFRGFDGNYEGEHLGVAYFLVDDMDRFARFKGRDLNSHVPTVDVYRRMLRVSERMRHTAKGDGLGRSPIVELLNANFPPGM